MRPALRALAVGLPLAAFVVAALADETAGRKFALLVGVKNYQGTGLGDLRFTENDAEGLADVLTAATFRRVVLMTESAAFARKDRTLFPSAGRIRRQLDSLLEDAKAGDTVVLGFSGHGVELNGRYYFCPEEGVLAQPETLVSMADITDKLKACPATVKLLIADACRNAVGPKSPVVENLKSDSRPELPKPPEGVVTLFSCSKGQKSFESAKHQRGFLFHHVIEGFKGAAADRRGAVTLSKLVSYAVDEVPLAVKDEYRLETQRPEMLGSIAGNVTLVHGLVRPATDDRLDLGGGAIIQLAAIPAGSFTMGSPDGDDDEKPSHTVRIAKAFWMGTTEVTVGQFKRFVADTGHQTEAEADGKGGYGLTAADQWETKPEYTWKNPGYPLTDAHPVSNVTWNDAVKFCAWAARKSDRKVRLPSEAEWEYSCRAGTTTTFHCGDDGEQLARYGNVADASGKRKFRSWTGTIAADDGYATTAPVGKFLPNAWGLFDMHGNVWEWCRDGRRKFEANAVTDPEGPTNAGGSRANRGGAFYDIARRCRAAYRTDDDAAMRSDLLGFRVSVVR